ncbi:glycosyltransferase family 9 protein [Aromatoleum sp.]|uniref:glycosyltransferase family 9 protein n=1 Tax=Aromatoleum sp. TaxID=2307007 RepID=UPI002FCA38E7
MDSVIDAARWRAARRILAVRLDNLGDVLMTTPALRALRVSAPGRHITLLASGSGAAAAPYVPEIDDLVVADSPWLPGAEPAPDAMLATVERLRAGRFDAAVIFTVYSQSALPAALLCWLAGVPLRLAHCRENPYHLLSDWLPDPEPHEVLRHEARRQLDLVAAVGATTVDARLSFRVPPRDVVSAHRLLRAAGIDPERRFVVVHPGASAPSRRYPEDLFAAAIGHVHDIRPDLGDLQLVFTGDASEAPAVERIRALIAHPTRSLAGQLGLGELGAVLDAAALLIANNTGPVHLAAALGTPVVDLYALTNPQHAPWQVPHRVLYEDVPCRFCYKSVCPQGHHHCLRLLDPARVAAAAHELLALGAERSSAPLPAAPADEWRAA